MKRNYRGDEKRLSFKTFLVCTRFEVIVNHRKSSNLSELDTLKENNEQ